MPNRTNYQVYVEPYIEQVLEMSPGSRASFSLTPTESVSAKHAWWRFFNRRGYQGQFILRLQLPGLIVERALDKALAPPPKIENPGVTSQGSGFSISSTPLEELVKTGREY